MKPKTVRNLYIYIWALTVIIFGALRFVTGNMIFGGVAVLVLVSMFALLIAVDTYYRRIEGPRTHKCNGKLIPQYAKYGMDIICKPEYKGLKQLYYLVHAEEGFTILHVDELALKEFGMDEIIKYIKIWEQKLKNKEVQE